MESEQTAPAAPPEVSVMAEPSFVAVLARLEASLVFSTRPGNVVFLGAGGGTLTLDATPVSQPLGLAANAQRIALAGTRSVTVFANAARLATHHPAKPGIYDAFYIPRTVHFTGECHMHDMVFFGDAIIGANTNFSCICRVDGSFSFEPLWHPQFISKLRAEDRCHLNGFAAQGDKLAYVTALAATDVARGWRTQPDTAGLLIEAATQRVLRDDLCMPHSPRLVGEALYVLNGGEGQLLAIDRTSGTARVMTSLPGFAHGLCEYAGVLFVGLSQNRISRKGNPPPVAQRVQRLIAGVAAVEAMSGRVLGLAEFNSGVGEVYDVQVLPGIRRAGLSGVLADGGLIGVDTPQSAFWMSRQREDDDHILDAAAVGNYAFRVTR